MSFGKIRASYGTTGNDQIGDYKYLTTYSAYYIPYQGVSTLTPTALGNPYYGWEVNKKLEGGVDLGFLKDRIYLSADYFRNRSGNQLVGEPLTTVAGFTTVTANLPAVVQNTGIELTLNTKNIKTRSLTWTSSLNLTVPRNKLISFPGLAENPNYQYFYSIGKPILGSHPSYHYTGVDPQTGLYTFQDLNGDGLIDYRDRQFLKTPTQNYYGGFDNNFSYKGWTLDIFFQFVKQTGVNDAGAFFQAGEFNINIPSAMQNAWKNPGDNASIQRYTTSGGTALTAARNFSGSDDNLTDASFIRLKNVQLAYSLPISWQQKMHVQNFRVFAQGQNLLTITKYRGLDPENQSTASLPPLRMITIGLEVGL